MSIQSLPHPESYTAWAFLERGGDLQRITVPWKDPQQNHIVVKVLACGVCGSDQHVTNGSFPIAYPRIPGHEIVGEVVAVPASEEDWKLGQRVGGPWHGGHCGHCTRCREGDFVTCEHEDVNGVSRDGGYAEYVTLRSEAVVAVPEDMDPADAAPLLCAGITCFNSLRHMDVTPPDLVAVHGIGGLGHLALQIVHAMGFRVVAISSGPRKEALARELGAHEYIDASAEDPAAALKKLGGAKVIMETVQDSAAIQKVVPGLTIGGTLLLLALEASSIAISPLAMVMSRLSIRGWAVGHAKDCEDTLAFAQAHKIKPMVEKYSLEDAKAAYDRRSSARFRAIIVPGL